MALCSVVDADADVGALHCTPMGWNVSIMDTKPNPVPPTLAVHAPPHFPRRCWRSG